MFLRQLLRNALVRLRIVRNPEYVTRLTDHQPGAKQIRIGEVIAVRGQNGPKWACLLCPCGSGEVVRLALERGSRPVWKLAIDYLGRPSLKPSIWQRARCKCHFRICRGELRWCPD